MKSIKKLSVLAVVAALVTSLAGCADMNRRQRDTVIGAGGGAAAGALLGGGVLGTAAGAAAGGIIGNQVGK